MKQLTLLIPILLFTLIACGDSDRFKFPTETKQDPTETVDEDSTNKQESPSNEGQNGSGRDSGTKDKPSDQNEIGSKDGDYIEIIPYDPCANYPCKNEEPELSEEQSQRNRAPFKNPPY